LTLLQALSPALPAGFSLRPRSEADLAFLGRLYASTREEELAAVDWPAEQKTAFLLDQFGKQHAHYLQHYPRAQWLVIERDGQPVGRIYVEQTRVEIRLMDIALLPAERNRGVGTALTQALLAHADRAGLPVTLHVEPFNPALRMYVRLGFERREERGYYFFMERCARAIALS
jgi:ribosomal protein S18 acetylase RimI-like enzyme